MLCGPTVLGYSFTLNRWLSFSVDHLSEITWRHVNEALNDLPIPIAQKQDIARRLTGANYQGQIFLRCNQPGTILLLSTPHGTDRVSIAQQIADMMKVPLYTVRGPELGPSLSQAASSLKVAVELASRWRAVLLIDECDELLEPGRSAENDETASNVLQEGLQSYRSIVLIAVDTASAAKIDAAFRKRLYCELDCGDLGGAASSPVTAAAAVH
ncbi:hypothetical protein F5883DRAFT_507561 [Diaporthe sp. PMI_573]|nr:hypothetical protein F5883DRAFT_507561 [Diaporthaceae sp. PMI_573]